MGILRAKLTYFNLGRIGRGEPIVLLMKDAGIPYEYNTIKGGVAWPPVKKQVLEEGHRFGTVPFIELDGKLYECLLPIMRTISKKIGKYNGSNEDEDHLIDGVADHCGDWLVDATEALLYPNDVTKTEPYVQKKSPRNYDRFEHLYGLHTGPYLLGEKISYPDFLAYNNVVSDGRNSKRGLEKQPNLARLVKAIEGRPNLKDYLASLPDQPLMM